MQEKIIKYHQIEIGYGLQFLLVPRIVDLSCVSKVTGQLITVIVGNSEFAAGLCAQTFGKIGLSAIRSPKDSKVKPVSDERQR